MIPVRTYTLLICGLCALHCAETRAQQAPAGFKVDLVFGVPDIEHPSAVTCDSQGNLFVGEDPMDARGPATERIDRIVLIRWDPGGGPPVKTVFCEHLSAVFGTIFRHGVDYADLYFQYTRAEG